MARPVSRGRADSGAGVGAERSRIGAERAPELPARRWTSYALDARRRERAFGVDRCDQRVHRLDASRGSWRRPATTAALDAVLWDASEALRIAAVLLSAVHARVVREILRRLGVRPRRRVRCVSTATPTWQAEGTRTVQQGMLLWPRLEAAPADAATANVSTKERRVTDQPNPTAPPRRRRRPPRASRARRCRRRRRGRSTRGSRSTTS